MKYFIDFEAAQPSKEIISIGCIREDGETFYSLISPVEGGITPFITDLTGITMEMLQNAPSPDYVFESFYNWVFVNDENPDFFVWGNGDIDFLRCTFRHVESRKARMVIGYMCGSIIDYAKVFCQRGKITNCSLIKAYNGLIDNKRSQNHNALDDAILLFEVYNAVSNITVTALKEKMNVIISTHHPKKKETSMYIAWNRMGLPSGTICIINKHKEATLHWASIEEATQWIIDNKVTEKQRDTVNIDRIKKKIKCAYNGGHNYYNLKWRIIA